MEENIPVNFLSPEDALLLQKAKETMLTIGWAVRNVNKVGNTIESKIKMVPDKYVVKLQQITQSILLGILKANLLTISSKKKFRKPSKKTYKAVVTGTGALSGFFGAGSVIGTPIFVSELTITTKFIMRSIMDIARSQGEDIYALEGQLACIEVFALGGDSTKDDSLETAYYATRIGLDAAIKKATTNSLKLGLDTLVKNSTLLGSKAITQFVTKIASRLSLLITEKFLSQALPVLGALGGGTINYIYVDHFQKMATAHFTIKKLERKYSKATIESLYNKIKIVTS